MTPRSEGETDASRALKSALLRMHAATVLFGLSGIFGKLCACTPAMLVCGRAFIAVGALSLLCLARRHAPWQGLRCRELAGLALSGTLLTVHFVTFFMGIQLGGVAVGTLGFACFPAFTTLFEALAYREKPSGREYACMFLVSCGLALITPSFSLADATTAGLAWGVLSGAVYALVAIANRRTATNMSGTQACWWQNLVIIVCLLPFTAEQFSSVSDLDWLWIACLGLICTALAYSLYVSSLAALKARRAAVIISLEPVYAILAAWLLFGETPGPRMTAGGLLIVGTVLRMNRA